MSLTEVEDGNPQSINERYASQRITDDPIVDLFYSGHFSDCTITCGNRVWKLHKAILTARCEFFAKLFTNPNQDSKLNAIVLDDIDPEILDIILQHLYVRIPYNFDSHIERCETPEDVQEVVELIVASDRVGVLDLVKQAVVILKDMIEEVEWSEEDSEEIAPMIAKAVFELNARGAFAPVKSATAHFIARTFREHEILRGAMNDLLGQYAKLRMLVMSDSLLNSSPSVSTLSTSTINTVSNRPKLQRSRTSKPSTSSASSWRKKLPWP